MSRMTGIAAALLAGFAVIVLVAYFVPSDDDGATDTTAAQVTTETTTADGAEGTDEASPDDGQTADGGADGGIDAALASAGEQTATAQGCTACHSIDGSDGVGPSWSGVYGTEVELDGGEVVIVDDAYLEEATLDPATQVRAGFGPSMPSYEGKVSAEELSGLVEYIKSLGG